MKVLYIMSSGRSGSTIINTILGNHHQVFACGELCHIAHPFMKDIYCSCGKRFVDCQIWSEILTRLDSATNGMFLDGYLSLQRHFEIYRTPYDKIENAFFRFIMTIYRQRGLSEKDRQIFNDYAKMTSLLFQTISDVSGKSILVDSSKNLLRAYWMSQIPEIDLYVLHIVRDGRGVVAATKKTLPNEYKKIGWNVKPIKVWRSSVAWTKTNFMIDRHLKRVSYNSLFFRYDDFAQNPSGILEQIGNWLNLNMNELIAAINNGTVLPPGHTMAGNKGRMRPVDGIFYDCKWKKKLTPFEQLQFNCIGGYLNKKYGFR